MGMKTARIRICPRCRKAYHGAPALSRKDNETYICPDCGTREALESMGVDEEEQKQILETIHRCKMS
jgi:hydrogenase maturation factor HypF (carbamoyltransferase family)